MIDSLGDRMKSNYESRTRSYIPRRTYTIIRIDGKAFHTYTKSIQAERPFCKKLTTRMSMTAEYLCKNIQGAQLAYTQSDEISILLTDFASVNTDAWFDGNIQKICSVSASLATARFNCDPENPRKDVLATFDSRVFVIPDRIEVLNYFLWRHKDCARNSISMLARAYFSHKELDGKKTSQMHDMLMEKGINWAKIEERFKNGSLCRKGLEGSWETIPAPNFRTDREIWDKLVPTHGYENAKAV